MFNITEIMKFTNYRFEYRDLSKILANLVNEYNNQNELDSFHFFNKKLANVKNGKYYIRIAIYDRIRNKLYQSSSIVISDREGLWLLDLETTSKRIYKHSSLNNACLHKLTKLYCSIKPDAPKQLEYQCYVVTDNSNSITNPDEIDNLIINKDSRVSKILIRDLKGRIL